MRLYALLVALMLSGCVETAQNSSSARKPVYLTDENVRQFKQVVKDVEPVAERYCAEQLPRANCDFLIVVDDRSGQPPNAFQTLDRSGRPILAFTVSLLADVNRDELAFIMSHEAAHHIAQHIPKQQTSAVVGGILIGGIAAATGAGAPDSYFDLGASVGGRIYSKEHELEADSMGAVITHLSGYDPLKGAEFFNRIPDPGDRFLGTHPPNAERIAAVRRAHSGL
ncbi:MAG: M48 family metallopeptidase [Roseovarius sp.]|nr:M48 family metallopeptidase [Roseovarius sp.]